MDQTGWSIQSDGLRLGNATVTVTSGGETLPVNVTTLSPGYGSMFAIRFNPQGWKTQAGKTYTVTLSGLAQPIEYSVQVVSCP